MKLFGAALSNVGRLIPFKATYGLWKRLCVKDRKKKTNLYFYTNYAPDYYYVEIEKPWFDQVTEVPFEDTKLFIPSGWNPYLTQVYGDFMKLPPKDRQIPEHSDMEIKIYG